MYDSLDSIPAHIFLNMNCTIPATPELARYIEFLLQQDEEHLRYIYRQSQQYNEHGGASKLSFQKWLRSLRYNLNKRK